MSKYREFLKTKFWKRLSYQKRMQAGKCEVCGYRKGLQCHHKFYRSNWYETTVDDLVCLCERCHRKAHGVGASEVSARKQRKIWSRKFWAPNRRNLKFSNDLVTVNRGTSSN